jgi:hypothetical protein
MEQRRERRAIGLGDHDIDEGFIAQFGVWRGREFYGGE